jgi:hypothetical protein
MRDDLQAGPKEPRCLGTFPEDPEEGDHRAGCPPITEDDGCACPGYQQPQVFSYDQVIELLKLFGATYNTRIPRPAGSRPHPEPQEEGPRLRETNQSVQRPEAA